MTALALTLALLLSARAVPVATVEWSPDEMERVLRHSPLPPLNPDETNSVADDMAAARLGQRLFFDPRLSGSGKLSCASCHEPARSWSDGRVVAVGAHTGRRNTPSLWNVAYNRWFFWDGRSDSLWSQALKPIEGVDELAGDRHAAVALLARDPELRSAYQAVFAAPPDSADADRGFANLGKLLEAYERHIVSRHAPFDTFVEGLRESDKSKQAALGAGAQRGLRLFVGRAHCSACHSGPLFTDGEFHDTGVPDAAEAVVADLGRHDGIPLVLKDEFNALGAYSASTTGPRSRLVRFVAHADRPRRGFKTPSLRNVAKTAPYMHNGQLATLQVVVRHYSLLEDQIDQAAHPDPILVALHLSAEEESDLLAFLESLTDDALDPEWSSDPTAGKH
jgi:cytochrome c peroxidase